MTYSQVKISFNRNYSPPLTHDEEWVFEDEAYLSFDCGLKLALSFTYGAIFLLSPCCQGELARNTLNDFSDYKCYLCEKTFAFKGDYASLVAIEDNFPFVFEGIFEHYGVDILTGAIYEALLLDDLRAIRAGVNYSQTYIRKNLKLRRKTNGFPVAHYEEGFRHWLLSRKRPRAQRLSIVEGDA